jgi:hypothetical protein
MATDRTPNTLKMLAYQISKLQARISALDLHTVDEAAVQVYNHTLNDLLEKHHGALMDLSCSSPDGFQQLASVNSNFMANYELCVLKMGSLLRQCEVTNNATANSNQINENSMLEDHLLPPLTLVPRCAADHSITNEDAASTLLVPTKKSKITSTAAILGRNSMSKGQTQPNKKYVGVFSIAGRPTNESWQPHWMAANFDRHQQFATNQFYFIDEDEFGTNSRAAAVGPTAETPVRFTNNVLRIQQQLYQHPGS